jgi:transposase-like protein
MIELLDGWVDDRAASSTRHRCAVRNSGGARAAEKTRLVAVSYRVSGLVQCSFRRRRRKEHKRRNVLEHLPKHLHSNVSRILRDAWKTADAKLAKRRLERLASSLQADHPGAAASVREGLEETLTLQELGITGALYVTLRTTNPIENLNGLIAGYTRNVKRWRDGQMVLRWVASALSDARKRFRALRGFRDIPKLIAALQRRMPADEARQPKAA